jgi:hypothetical protein
VEIDEGQIVWEYDYYGGAWSDIYPLPEIPSTTSQLTASSSQVIAETKVMLTDWEAAYNNKDAQAFISFYSDQATCTDIIRPEWHVFTKNQLLEATVSRFNNEQLNSRLGNFFVSKDGHYAAVQGLYGKKPMVILLKIDNAKIVEQFVYINSSLGMGNE